MSIITLDFETYYDKDFSLSKISTEHYIRDPRFEVIGFGYQVDGGEPQWVTGSDERIAFSLHALGIADQYLLCHHTAFDAAILKWRFGIAPKYYLDTLSMARPLTGQTVGGSLAALAKRFNLGEKGTEVVKALGKRRDDFTPDELAQYGEYCKNDVRITYGLYQILKAMNPAKELYIQDLMLRMFIDPVLELDASLLQEHLDKVRDKKEQLMARIDQSIGRDALMSNPKFAEVLKKLGIEPPMKTSLRTGNETYAFGKLMLRSRRSLTTITLRCKPWWLPDWASSPRWRRPAPNRSLEFRAVGRCRSCSTTGVRTQVAPAVVTK